jgi:hypothetical protein
VKKKASAKKKTTAKKNASSIEKIVEENFKLLTSSAEVALQSYIELAKSFTDRKIADANGQLIDQVAEGWKNALIETTRILRTAYATLAKQAK